VNGNDALGTGLASFGLAFALTAALMPRTILALKAFRVGQVVSHDGPQSHLAKQGTPTMGGLAFLAGLILTSALIGIVGHTSGRFGGAGVAAVLLLIAGYGCLGFLDDYLIISRGKALGLRARHKLMGQFLLAIVFVLWLRYAGRNGLYPTLVRLPGGMLELGGLYYAFAALFIVGMSNAVNLADGLDGLVAGLSTVTSVALASTSVLSTAGAFALDPGLAAVCWAIAGASLGFLWFNAHPAAVFMGDTGSLALGAGFAAIAILSKQEFALLVFGLVFVAEALSVVIQVISFKTTGKRVFRMSPFHHHFELIGWPEEKVVARFWIAGALACAVGVSGRMMKLW